MSELSQAAELVLFLADALNLLRNALLQTALLLLHLPSLFLEVGGLLELPLESGQLAAHSFQVALQLLHPPLVLRLGHAPLSLVLHEPINEVLLGRHALRERLQLPLQALLFAPAILELGLSGLVSAASGTTSRGICTSTSSKSAGGETEIRLVRPDLVAVLNLRCQRRGVGTLGAALRASAGSATSPRSATLRAAAAGCQKRGLVELGREGLVLIRQRLHLPHLVLENLLVLLEVVACLDQLLLQLLRTTSIER
mmetsp:Transcript_121950/g.272304  ORF Transcript_121950/g.272304 Transcript_121950/m.272304 type:complete len:255 (+) Transcript_121950:340-1104(+)